MFKNNNKKIKRESIKSESKVFNLKKGEILKPNKSELTINCIVGAMWITFLNSEDFILQESKKIILKNEKSILLQALKNCTVEIT